MKNSGCEELGRRGNGELLFNGSRVSVLQDQKGSGDGLHTSVNVLNTAELYT